MERKDLTEIQTSFLFKKMWKFTARSRRSFSGANNSQDIQLLSCPGKQLPGKDD